MQFVTLMLPFAVSINVHVPDVEFANEPVKVTGVLLQVVPLPVIFADGGFIQEQITAKVNGGVEVHTVPVSRATT